MSGIVTGMWDGSGIQSEGKPGKSSLMRGATLLGTPPFNNNTQHNVRHGCSFPISGSEKRILFCRNAVGLFIHTNHPRRGLRVGCIQSILKMTEKESYFVGTQWVHAVEEAYSLHASSASSSIPIIHEGGYGLGTPLGLGLDSFERVGRGGCESSEGRREPTTKLEFFINHQRVER